jgi:hypothetical protein
MTGPSSSISSFASGKLRAIFASGDLQKTIAKIRQQRDFLSQISHTFVILDAL